MTFVAEFRAAWPDVLIHSVPNGGKRHPAVAQKLKMEGLVPGIPDLHVPEWGLWVEMKRQKGGGLSPDQKAVISELERIGDTVIVGKGWEDAILNVRVWYTGKRRVTTVSK